MQRKRVPCHICTATQSLRTSFLGQSVTLDLPAQDMDVRISGSSMFTKQRQVELIALKVT